MRRVKLLSVLLFMLSGIIFGAKAQVIQSDSLALVALYDSTNGTNWKNSWDLNQPVSSWYGITISGDRVTQISLIDNQLSGHLPAQISHLTELTSLEITGNSGLNGSIPDWISFLTNLTKLILSSNQFSGGIPASLGSMTQLTELKLDFNQLSGEIPAELSNLNNLQSLYLNHNLLSGTIPASLGNLSSLVDFELWNNQLDGPVPDSLTLLNNLQSCGLYANQFNYLPDFSSLPNLNKLWVQINRLTFRDLEPQTYSQSLTSFVYYAQESVGESRLLSKWIGDSLVLSQSVGGKATHYQWQKDGQNLAGQADSVLLLGNLQREDAGQYTCMMTNDRLPSLTLYSQPVTVNVGDKGDIATDTTWSGADTIFIEKDIYVFSGARLTIEPGTVLYFTGHHALHVQGALTAEGTQADSIIFTAADTDSGWQGIYFKPNGKSLDSSYMAYCRLEHANTNFEQDSLYDGAITLYNYHYLSLQHSLLIHNQGYQGGAVHCQSGTHLFENNTFIENSATYGGALFSNSTDLELDYNFFKNNKATFGGAVFCQDYTSAYMNGNYLENNQSTRNGGSIYLSESEIDCYNDVYAHNEGMYGGAISSTYSQISLTNCTISDNHSEFFGGALYITYSSSAWLANTILWGNVADSSGNQLYSLGTGTEGYMHYCDIQDDSTGFRGPIDILEYENNLAQDPIFSYGESEPYRLSANSPCINAGWPDTQNLYLPETDIAGNTRIQEGRIDIGAYEGSSATAVFATRKDLPQTSKLYANYPNPFNPSTTIDYDVNRESKVELKIYNALGQLVNKLVDKRQKAGRYQLNFRAADLASGIYFYQLKIGPFMQTRKMILLR